MKEYLVLLTVLKSDPDGLLNGSFRHLLLPGTIAELRTHFREGLVLDAAASRERPGISSYVVGVGSVRPPTRSFLERVARLVANGTLEARDSFTIEAPVDLAPFIGRVDALSRELHFARKARQPDPPSTAEIIPLRSP